MKAAIVVFPGSNRELDAKAALKQATGKDPIMVWHRDTSLPKVDLVLVPGGFSYGDYLRCGAIAANSPVLREVKARAEQGMAVIGVCNGFQIVTEAGLLPGVLLRNANLKFVCHDVTLRVETSQSLFTSAMSKGQRMRVPVAHHDGNYFADNETLKRVEGDGQIVFRYADGTNPNGSINDIAGIINDKGNVLGLMPHPENLIEAAHGGSDGRALFEGALGIAA